MLAARKSTVNTTHPHQWICVRRCQNDFPAVVYRDSVPVGLAHPLSVNEFHMSSFSLAVFVMNMAHLIRFWIALYVVCHIAECLLCVCVQSKLCDEQRPLSRM